MSRKVFKIKKKEKKSIFKIDILNYFIFGIILVSFFIIFKLYQIQIIDGQKYNEIVVAQNQGYFTNNMESRGNIFFHDKGDLVSVASQSYGYTLAIVPKNIKNPKYIYNQLNQIIKIDEKEFFNGIKKNKNWKELKNKISEDSARKIIEKKLRGVVLVKKSWRIYPFNEIASKVIGSLGYDEDNNTKIIGKYGLEKYYNNILNRGKETKNRRIFDLFFKKKDIKTVFATKKISKEGDIVSSIDIEVSRFTEKVLKDIDKKFDSEYSIAIIMKPESGEIIAMSDSRTINFNKNKKYYVNPFVENKYEFGSIFKPIVVSIGLETGSITKDFSYNDKGCVKVLSYTICNYDKRGRGKNTDLQRIIKDSLNTGMIEIEKKIGHKTFFNFLLRSGFGEESGIDLSGEVSTNFSSLSTFNDVNFATATFGQGISFTPIGISRILATLANDGYLIDPHIVQKIEYGELIPDTNFISSKKRVFSEKTTEIMKEILIKRTDEIDGKRIFFNKDYTVAAKTGTAEIADEKGGYYKDKHLHSFFAFFPANAKPKDRYMVLIFTKDPKNVKYSVTTLTEPFYKIMNFLISYYNIKPDRANLDF